MRFLSYISFMTKNLDEFGLKSVVNEYDLFFIDIWGVVHDGINLHNNSIEVLENLSKERKEFVLLTNAPRPNEVVVSFLKKMGFKKFFKNVFTSGEASLKYLLKDLRNQKFFHIGPPRDFDLFNDFKNSQSKDLNESQYLLCTGLFDDHDQDLNYYKNLLEKHINKKMICTNPDLIVDRGNKRELCAGSVAMIFEKMGGEVVYFGKPYAEVYNQSIDNSKKRILSIGDNLNTDIKGANLLNYDSLLILNGVHKEEIKNSNIDKVSRQYESIVNYMQSDLKW